jgi:nucleoside-diphosphate-sugar epimerase
VTPERLLVTGCLGFIGRRLAEHYRAQGSEVRGVDVRPDPELDVIAGDIAEPGPWQDHAAGCDLVVHTAAMVSFRSGEAPFWRVNAMGTRNALDAAERAGARRFVHLSSIVVFGWDFEGRVDESHPVRANGVPYVDTKVASEQVVLQRHSSGAIECTVVRPGDVYGPRSRPWTAIPVEELRRGRTLLPRMGRGLLSMVYVDDLVEGIVAASGPEGAGGVFTITDERPVETREFFGHYARMLGRRRVPVAPTPMVRALARVAAVVDSGSEVTPAAVDYLARTGTYSAAKARRELGWEPKIGLEEGMERSEAWLRSEGMLAA